MTPILSFAFAERVTDGPVKVLPCVGLVIETVGGVVSVEVVLSPVSEISSTVNVPS